MSKITPSRRMPPNIQNAKTVKEVAGENPTFFNLKDNVWFNNRQIAIIGYQEKTGEYGDYLLIGAWLMPETEQEEPVPVVVMTGSENVMGRILAVSSEISEETPIIGTLRTIGDAWVLD